MKRIVEKIISQNICYFIDEVKVGGKTLYSITESIKSNSCNFREYDLNMYYSNFQDAVEKLDTL